MKISFKRRLLSNSEGCRLGLSTIDTLSDDVLLCIFNSYRRTISCSQSFIISNGWGIWPWHKLVHVCRRWRRLVFAYPVYLDLRLRCKSKTHVQAALDLWPALSLSIHATLGANVADEDDTIGALEHRDRIAEIHLRGLNHSQLEKCVALMQEPFPVLKSLELMAVEGTKFVITDAFLGGSAPLLQWIRFCDIGFPSLPKLLSSTGDLVRLHLFCIPMTGKGYISPDAIATCLPALTKLRSLTITFQQGSWPYPDPTDQLPPPSTYTVLPALVNLRLEGPQGYLEYIVDRIDAPLLKSGRLKIYDEPVFDTPRVPQFIHRAKTFKSLDKVDVYFAEKYIIAFLRSSIGPAKFRLSFPCSGFSVQVEIMEEICAQWPPLVSRVKFLRLDDCFYSGHEAWREDVAPWLGFLRPFTAVQTLRLCGEAPVSHVANVLGRLEQKGATEVLPTLSAIELHSAEDVDSEASCLLEPFLVAREESEHPLVVDVGIQTCACIDIQLRHDVRF